MNRGNGFLFGFEFQTGNAFVQGPLPVGVGERQTAWQHDDTKATLEGDETRRVGATADLEFVTPACPDEGTAAKAIAALSGLAANIKVDWTRSQKDLVFRRGQKYAGGTWLTDCAIHVYDTNFGTQAQGTLGIPLARYEAVLQTVWERNRKRKPDGDLDEESKDEHDWMETLHRLPAYQKATADGRGFLTACYFFLIRGTRQPASYFVDETLKNIFPEESSGLFDFSHSAVTRAINQKVLGLAGPPLRCYVRVGSDSPKNMFKLLHRTDFHSMFLSLGDSEREALLKYPVTDVIWPAAWGSADSFIFPLPYRADPAAKDTATRAGEPPLTTDEWIPPSAPALERGKVRWTLVHHGPTIAEWWESVLRGDKRRGGLPKDIASPPAGFQSRDPKLLDKFPQPSENKAEYYGMGSFPMDLDQGTGTKLAVFEYRDLMADRDIPLQKDLNPNEWARVLKVFVDNYVRASKG